MTTPITREQAIARLEVDEAKAVRLHHLLWGTWEDREEAHNTVNALVDDLRALLADMKAAEVAEQDVWANTSDTLQGLLAQMCAHVGFREKMPLYGATQGFHVTITRRLPHER